jgi:ABC-type sugar transport system ATPase subunit
MQVPTLARRLLEVRALSKSFGTLRALQEVDFTLRAGEIHALLGENGAGKSTLIKAVTGVFPRDAGIVRLGGAEVAPRSAKAAVDAGIATVYQEVNLLQNLSVAQNLYLGRQPTRFGLVREAEMRRAASRAARGVRPAYRCRRAARKLFGGGAAHHRDRARRRPVGAGADPRRADREPRSP